MGAPLNQQSHETALPGMADGILPSAAVRGESFEFMHMGDTGDQ
jgi:hypothetical protein